ncbi:MAG: bifunctional phosphoglucose/phosphomannose isomerase [Acidobacteria bacterium]|nr:bifunctional phosphoglucose/phosphomannose isomerase [Acidobacteriota bacterium]
MTILDETDRWKSIDPKAMHSLLDSFPDHVRSAAEAGPLFSAARPAGIRTLVITGLGGSAIGADLVKSVAGPDLQVPLIVNRDYDLPRFLDSSSLVVVCSYSGNTEETISAYGQAKEAGTRILCITSGGELAEKGQSDGYTVLRLPSGLPPRAALGYSLITLLCALRETGVVKDPGEDISETVQLLYVLRDRWNPASPSGGNLAKQLAASLEKKIVAMYGSSGIMEAAAYRWRCQIEENSKNLAFHHVLPEMNHNELVGWMYPEEGLRHIGVVLLRDKGDHPQVQRRFELVRDLITGKAGTVHEVWSEGESRLARVLSLLYLGDYVSLYLAYLNEVDPTPVQVIDYLKKALAVAR